MQLDGSYEFLELTQADGILVSNAREKDTGKLVQIHLFPAERSQDANQICQSIMGLPDAARRMIIKFGKDGTSTYFVTETLPAGDGIRGWIAAQTGHPAEAPPPPPPPKEGPGEFTRMYTQQDLSSGSHASAPAAPVPVAPAPKVAGEFTRMYTADEIRSLTANFRSPVPESRPAPIPEPPPPAPPARDAAPGLETFIFERSSVTRPAPVITPRQQPAAPPPPPPPPQPVYSRPEPLEPPPAPPRRASSMRDTFEAPQPIFSPIPEPPPAAVPAPPPQHASQPAAVPVRVEAPRAPAARFDWKVALLIAAALLVVVAIVIAIEG